MRFIIGIGSGRSGTHSLANLLNSQENTLCFHELNPACMKWEGADVTVKSMIREFEDVIAGRGVNVTVDHTSPHGNNPMQKISEMGQVDVVGDIGFYYLNYVPVLCAMGKDIRIPCIRRDKEETVRSYINKMKSQVGGRMGKILKKYTGMAIYRYRNHWVEHDGTKWIKDNKWDICYPKFEVKDLESALGLYWDCYYEKAAQFESEYPDKVRIFDIGDLNNDAGLRKILQFCGYDESPVTGKFHTNIGDKLK